MCESDEGNFEDALRSLAGELRRSVDRMISQVDVDEIAGSLGVDRERVRSFADAAEEWVRSRMPDPEDPLSSPRPADRPSSAPFPGEDDPLRRAEPHPLDRPTGEQGVALAALDSGRWVLEPGADMLTARGEGPAPRDSGATVAALRARDWIDAEGRLTLTGRTALQRWLAAGESS